MHIFMVFLWLAYTYTIPIWKVTLEDCLGEHLPRAFHLTVLLIVY